MKHVSIGVLVLLLTSIVFSQAAYALPKYVGCSDHAKTDIAEAHTFVKQNIGELIQKQAAGQGFSDRKMKTNRVKRRLYRKLDNLRFKCDRGPLKPNSCDGVYGKAGAWGRAMIVCYDNIVEDYKLSNEGFCELTKTVAHELAHKARLEINPRDHNNGRGYNDRVYTFGYIARDLCKQKGLSRALSTYNASPSNTATSAIRGSEDIIYALFKETSTPKDTASRIFQSDPVYTYSPTGDSSLAVTRSSVGFYNITFPADWAPDGNVNYQVTAYNNPGVSCSFTSMAVRCMAKNSELVNSSFVLLASVDIEDAYAFVPASGSALKIRNAVEGNDNAYDYTNDTQNNPVLLERYDAAGIAGVRITFQDYVLNSGGGLRNILVTSNDWKLSCQSVNTFNVMCFTRDGKAQPNPSFYILATGSRDSLDITASGNGKSDYTVDPESDSRYASGPGIISIDWQETGKYKVSFGDISVLGGSAQVKAHGFIFAICGVTSWSGGSVYVNCTDGAGNPRDATFSLRYFINPSNYYTNQ